MDRSDRTVVPLNDQLPAWSSTSMYNGKKCIDLYGLLKNLGPSSVGDYLLAWIPSTVKEALCPACCRRVPIVGSILWSNQVFDHGKKQTPNPELFVKGIELDEYNIIHRIECYYDGSDALLDPPSSIHIYTVGQLGC